MKLSCFPALRFFAFFFQSTKSHQAHRRTRYTATSDNSSHQLKNAVNALKRSQNLQNHIAATDSGALAAPLQLLVTLSDAGGARLR